MKRDRLLFAAAIAVSISTCVVITTVYARNIGYAPDEGNHLSMVMHHGDTVRLATWEDMRWGTTRGHAYQLFSPLPYVLHIFWWRQVRGFVDPEDRKAIRILVRLAGLPIAVLQFWVIFRIARFFFRSKWGGLLVALGVNLLPQLRYLHAYVNADAASILMASVCAWLLLRLVMGKSPSSRTAIFVGLALAGLAHAKYNVWIIALPLFIFFVFRTWVNTGEWQQRLRLIGTAILIPALLAGWFHLHVYTELANGHILAGRDHQELMHSTFEGAPISQGKSVRGRIREVNGVWTSATGYFARIGSLPRWYRNALLAGTLVGSIAVLLAYARRRAATFRPAVHYYAVGLAVLLFTYLILALQPELGIQGRLLLGFLPFTPVLLWGLDQELRRVPQCRALQPPLLVGFVGFMLLGNLLTIKML